MKTKKTFFHYLLLHQRNVLETYCTDFHFLPFSFTFLHNSNKTLTTHISPASLGLIVWTFVSSYCWPQLSAVCRTRPQVPKYTRVLWVQRSWDTGLGWKELCIGQGGTWLFQGPLFRVRIEPQARVCTFVDSHCFCFFVLLLRKWENSCLCHSND